MIVILSDFTSQRHVRGQGWAVSLGSGDLVGDVPGQVVEEARTELAEEGGGRQGTVLSKSCGQLFPVRRDRGQRPERDSGSREDVWGGRGLSMRAGADLG